MVATLLVLAAIGIHPGSGGGAPFFWPFLVVVVLIMAISAWRLLTRRR